MHWNYRIVQKTYNAGTENEETLIGIHEAHYNGKNELCAVTAEPVSVGAEDMHGIKNVLQKMLFALDRPVIVFETQQWAAADPAEEEPE